jgi:hypothetical protein
MTSLLSIKKAAFAALLSVPEKLAIFFPVENAFRYFVPVHGAIMIVRVTNIVEIPV